MMLAVPLLVVMYLMLYLILSRLHRNAPMAIAASKQPLFKNESGAWLPGQRNTLIAFGITVALWISPGFIALFIGSDSSLYTIFNSRMHEAVAALIGATLLFLLPVDWGKREFTLTWRQAVDIDWGTLLLFGGGLSLGSLMFETRLAESLGSGLLHLLNVTSLWGITAASIVFAILVSEASSNTSSATMAVPVVIALAQAAQVNPLPPALGATLGASWGFMLPVSTPPNAIVYGSGMVPITKMIRAGILIDISGAIVIWIGLRLMLPLLGWI
jgi:sodium-dependent dicarboxylate transporter 2/3/5